MQYLVNGAFPRHAPVYRVSFDGVLPPVEDLRPNVDIDSLRRTSEVKGKYDLGSFTGPLTLYCKTLFAMGQTNVARCLDGILVKIQKQISKLRINTAYIDDYIRKQLKYIHNYFFVKVSSNVANMLMCHLHTLGGPSPYTEDQIVKDIDSWVKGEIDNMPREWIQGELDRLFAATRRVHQSLSLNFDQYCTDVMRWATSGGAPASEIMGTKVRSKWAWGFSRLSDWAKDTPGRQIIAESYATTGHYTVALKREPAKTREIISGPMGSHIRQSYLLYRNQEWDLPSPAFKQDAYQAFMDKQYASYCSIDGDRFDHNVPKWLVMDIVSRMAFDDETRKVVALELEHLDQARLVYHTHEWKWEHGLLSGWRMTSLLGTIVSHLAARWIKERTKYVFSHVVLGDDIILCSDIDDLRVTECVKAYQDFGIPANPSKSVSGRVGEFLRKVSTPQGILGYPGLALKSVFYASPWLNQYQRSVQSEIAHGWWTFVSRVLPHRRNNRVIFSLIERMRRDVWFSEDEFYKWIQTPMCMGGGGTLETSEQSYWLAYLVNTEKTLNREAYFFSIFGIGNSEIHRTHRFKRIRPSKYSFQHFDRDIPTKPIIPDNINKTITIMRWYFLNKPNSYLTRAGIKFSKSVRGLTNTKLLELLLGQSDRLTSVISLLHVGEQMSNKLNSIVQMISVLRPRGPTSSLIGDAYLYLERFLENKMYPLITW